MCLKTAIKKTSTVFQIISGIATTAALIGLWIWGTSDALATDKASIKSGIVANQNEIININRRLSIFSDRAEAREKARLEDHDLIIQYKVRQDHILKGISELKELIKENRNHNKTEP